MKAKLDLITFEQAMRSTGRQSIDAYGEHVNPVEAHLLRLIGIDRRYTRAEGMYLHDDQGGSCLDFTGGCGALVLGHNPPEVLDAVRQAQALPSVLLVGVNPLMGALGANLAQLLPGDLSVVSFGSGGAEAVELALKTARAATGRAGLVGCELSYHGQSFGAISVCGGVGQRDAAGPLLPCCETVPFGDLDALERALQREDAAAFIVEPIQGEGGVRVPPPGYLKGAEELCRRHGTLLVLDEIQTGFGRTGVLFACDREGVRPDIITLSKALGAGVVPVSLSVTTPGVWKRAFGTRERFDMTISTFGGNPAACAAALKTIEIVLRDDLAGRAAELGRHARARLEGLRARHPQILSIRGEGLLLGVQFAPQHVPGGHAAEDYTGLVTARLLNKHGILTAYCDLDPSVLRFEPPLIVTKEQIDTAVDAIEEVLGHGVGGLALSLGKSLIERAVGHAGKGPGAAAG